MAAARIAYFSMEIAFESSIPTYSGGLGVLAGDTLRSAADLGLPMVAVTLVHRKGYFRQRLDEKGNQTEDEAPWQPEKVLEPADPIVSVPIEGRSVQVRAWRFAIEGVSGHVVPVHLLDTNLPDNSPWDQALTDHLYGGDEHYRLCQEVVLGIGGVRMLQALGYGELQSYHMNEGHSGLLALGLLEQRLGKPDLRTATEADIEAVRERCVFTTHTPVPAGHDQFPRSLMRQVLGDQRADVLEVTRCCPDNALNMTYLALRFSRYINGVAMHHGEISHDMYPNYPVRAITNGVHAVTWTSAAFCALYDRHIPEWRRDNHYLRYAVGIPLGEIAEAHRQAKWVLLEEVRKAAGTRLDARAITLGFARRAASYKRADLLFSNLDRLKWIATRAGPLQMVFAGKAHPRDEEGKRLIRRVFEAAQGLRGSIEIVYVQDYDMRWGQLITSGVDVWLNTPHRPYEASGTSGMKAALNGVPSLSVPDGWWYEGHFEGVTGWDIGHEELVDDPAAEAASLYDKLELVILPMFYTRPNAFVEVMRSTIALNGAFFNAQRMLSQYALNAYSPEATKTPHLAGAKASDS
ncbi:MAG TPA: alpha-glucan family phosphorylase [Candidatus Acidoferrales bacterium]|nr:alpha-glucan family phosphorylase [Candidatus Acidoferrales bacterium]